MEWYVNYRPVDLHECSHQLFVDASSRLLHSIPVKVGPDLSLQARVAGGIPRGVREGAGRGQGGPYGEGRSRLDGEYEGRDQRMV